MFQDYVGVVSELFFFFFSGMVAETAGYRF